jgi:hypothetical protein
VGISSTKNQAIHGFMPKKNVDFAREKSWEGMDKIQVFEPL